jgi:hypothetical protein
MGISAIVPTDTKAKIANPPYPSVTAILVRMVPLATVCMMTIFASKINLFVTPLDSAVISFVAFLPCYYSLSGA